MANINILTNLNLCYLLTGWKVGDQISRPVRDSKRPFGIETF
jgi:hypothetical protein